jgi:hypothetical protein
LASATLASVLVVSGAFLQQGGATFWINAFFLVAVFLIPAQTLARPRDVLREWRRLLLVTLLGTLGWDLATGFVAGTRPFLSEWYLVYTSGPVTLMLLYLGHAWLAAGVARFLHRG